MREREEVRSVRVSTDVIVGRERGTMLGFGLDEKRLAAEPKYLKVSESVTQVLRLKCKKNGCAPPHFSHRSGKKVDLMHAAPAAI